jgi:PAS domain S-box-containing protein
MIRRDTGGTFARRLNVAAIAVALALCLAAVMTLAVEVHDRLSTLAEANSDSVQWVLSQVEVELLQLQLQLAAPTPDLDRVRERFDIFYSRIDTLHDSRHFADLRMSPEFADPLASIDAFFARALPVVDGPEAALRAAVPGLAADLAGLHPGARTMSLAGVAYFAEQSDLRRQGVATTLRGLAFLLSAMFAALLLLVAALVRLNARRRREAEDNRLTAARLETIFTTSADAIVVADREGRVLDLNRAAEAMFGFARADLLHRPVVDEVLPPESRVADLARIDAELDAGRSGSRAGGRLEVEVMRRDRSRFPAEVSVAAAESSGGEIVIAFVRDISERRRAERDLIAALDRAREGERAKADFLTVMSHEMRTPLNGLLGSTEILAATPLDPGQRDLVDVIATSAHVLLHHVNGVLDLSRAEAGAAASPDTAFDCEALVAEVVANQRGLAEAEGTRLAMVNIGDPVGRVLGRPGQLRQILLNLVGNAVKFTRNGAVTVEIEALDGTADGVGRRVEFRVIDSGIGIAKADLERVFDDFVRLDTSYGRETGGTGLGLGITRRLVQALGGEIDATSHPGLGSRFRVRLPFAVDATAGQAPVAPGAATGAVLIVDDNAINRFVLRHLLEETGLTVAEAEDGAEGVARAEAAAFDLILMDISMPRMDGIEAARRIRAGLGPSSRARIVAVTAHAQPGERQRFREAGMSDCLVKPVTRGMLAVLLAGGEPEAPDEPPAPAEPVDAAVLADLAAHLGDAPAGALICRFLAEGDAMMARLAVGLPRDEARALCHGFAGSAATFGAVAMAARLVRAEAALTDGLPLPGGIEALVALWADSRARLAALIPRADRAAE